MIDLAERTIMFTLNGEMLISDSGSEMAFKEIEIGEGKRKQIRCMSKGMGSDGDGWRSSKYLLTRDVCAHFSLATPLSFRVYPRVQLGSIPGGQDQPGPECQHPSLLFHMWPTGGF